MRNDCERNLDANCTPPLTITQIAGKKESAQASSSAINSYHSDD